MASRPKGYGLSAELKNKIDGKYDPELEEQARNWIEAVLGESVFAGRSGQEAFHETLKDGVILCRIAQRVIGSIKYNESKMAFKMMENIGKFLEACDGYGVPKSDMFQTVDLYESQNIPAVINGIHALGRKAQANGFDGPVLGPKEATANKREFNEEALRAGDGVIGLQMGSNQGASQSGVNFGMTRQIVD